MDNYPLLHHNTFGMDVYAERFLEYDSEEALLELICGGEITQPCLHIGAGSNLLFAGNYGGTILHSRIKGIEVTEEDRHTVCVRVGAGMIWDDFVAMCVKHGWYGAENLSYIPGEVGAAAVQNIGAYGVEVKDLIESVETVDLQGQKHTYYRDECEYGYRQSLFKRPEMRSVFVTRVCFRLNNEERYSLDYGTIRQELESTGEPIGLQTVRDAVIRIRRSKLPDPAVQGNAGSFFVNPIISREQFELLSAEYPSMPHYDVDASRVKIPAAWLIEQCGWKGRAMGRAAVSERQALVLVNLGGATAAEILALSDAVRRDVNARFGIQIVPEVNIIGG